MLYAKTRKSPAKFSRTLIVPNASQKERASINQQENKRVYFAVSMDRSVKMKKNEKVRYLYNVSLKKKAVEHDNNCHW